MKSQKVVLTRSSRRSQRKTDPRLFQIGGKIRGHLFQHFFRRHGDHEGEDVQVYQGVHVRVAARGLDHPLTEILVQDLHFPVDLRKTLNAPLRLLACVLSYQLGHEKQGDHSVDRLVQAGKGKMVAGHGLERFHDRAAAVIIKHTNPCGAALAKGPLEAYLKARECDPLSAFGGIVGFNRIVDGPAAQELSSTFLEAVIAPGYTEEALEIFKAKKNVRVMQVPILTGHGGEGYDLKKVVGGLLIQGRDLGIVQAAACRVVTARKPTADELTALDFAWKVCKHVKSNAIVFTTSDQTVGIGAGQMSRVDSSRIAVQKAQLPTKGTVLASDAFFPFRDGVDAAAEAGVTAIIQPGGSVRDEEVIRAADEHGMAMVFTSMRHFRH